MLNLLLLLLGIAPLVFSFHVPRFVVRPATAVVKASKIQVESDERAVGLALCRILEQEYQRSIAEKNSFVFCISGGSMLKMLSHLNGVSGIDWSKCTMVANDSLVAVSDQNIIYCTTSFTYIQGFVSHRCVPLDDDAATFHKARPVFLDSWLQQGLKVVTVMGTSDVEKEAYAYENALRSIKNLTYSDGFPVFDLLLVQYSIQHTAFIRLLHLIYHVDWGRDRWTCWKYISKY